MKREKAKAFATEVELCARFLGAIDTELWTSYAESCGWDILLVRKADGFQIGIQAKLKMNAHVISQAIESRYGQRQGPDCRAVLVPSDASSSFGSIADAIGITIIKVKHVETYDVWRKYHEVFEPALPEIREQNYIYASWYEMAPDKRCKLPEYVPDVAAGASAPVQLTPWKISAIKIAVLLETRGYVTKACFKELRIDHRRWLEPGYQWLCFDRSRRGFYTAGPRIADFKGQHPKVYAEIVADFDKWAPPLPPELPPLPMQADLLKGATP